MGRQWLVLALAGLWVLGGCERAGRLTSSGVDIATWRTQAWPMVRGGPGLLGNVSDPVIRRPRVAWSLQVGAEVTSEAAVAAGLIVVGTADGSLVAVDSATRRLRWQIRTGDRVEATPAIDGGLVFAGSHDGKFRALDAVTGQEKWRLDGQDKFPTGAVVVDAPDGVGRWLLVNGYDGSTRCLRPNDGSVIWGHTGGDYINGSPAVIGNDSIAFGGCDALLHVLALRDGQTRFEIASDAQVISSVGTWGSDFYAVNHANQLVAADARTGRRLWLYDAGDVALLTAPALDDGHVFIGTRDKQLRAVDRRSGKLLWRFQAGGRIESAPLVFDDAVVFGCHDGRLYALDKHAGKEIWRIDLGEELNVAPAFAAGQIIIGGGEGSLFVIGGDPSP